MTPHERLRRLREGRSFGSQKAFCSHAFKYGYSIKLRRYREIEKGTVAPTINEIIDICEAMKISADAWLFGVDGRINLSGLDSRSVSILSRVADVLRDEQ